METTKADTHTTLTDELTVIADTASILSRELKRGQFDNVSLTALIQCRSYIHGINESLDLVRDKLKLRAEAN